MDSIEDQTLALAGMFQAVALVESLAKTGTCDKAALQCSVGSIFVASPDKTLDVYKEINGLAFGFKVLNEFLQANNSKTSPESIRYVLSLLHLEKKLRKNRSMLQVVARRLEKAEGQLQHFDICHDNVIGNLADIYSDTISTFSFRIQVRGQFNHLQQPRVANSVRALLLAGIRSTMLWRQLGGSRLKLLWQKNTIKACALDYYEQIDPLFK